MIRLFQLRDIKINFYHLLLTVMLIVAVVILFEKKYPHYAQKINFLPTPQPLIKDSSRLVPRTKSSSCQKRGALPDPQCTPGDVIPTATTSEICTPGYAKSVRDVSAATKKLVYQSYGIKNTSSEFDKIDHLISLQLGGSNELANLWPTNKKDHPGAQEKDQIENILHDKLCAGEITLEQAQTQIASDWVYIYKIIFDTP